MKTMWFTFLFGAIVPLGIFFSMFSLSLYYFIDKYNVLRRRTIKESLSLSVSIKMIDMLDLIIIFFAVGHFTVSYHLFKRISTASIILLAIGFIYALLPL